ncbi:hypothetical protein GCM10009715_27960 [Paeniglutamicibacter psychrophenolicus]|uniref:Uncharacterized protein n=1 Tax=Paeniglutamicibacter psychrophenolicus TaxID=257454 RepID=A0ABS4WEV8_9MICC|nr:hypothetical protein [Paeniglutamicibacter psychrophenolicus]
MGRALLASDVEAGPKDPAGSLIYREQFSSATTSGRESDSSKIPFEDGPPIHNVTVSTGQHKFAGSSWATNQHQVGFDSWCERDQLFLLDVDSEVTGLATQPFRLTMPRMPCRREISDHRVQVVSDSWASGIRATIMHLCATHELLARHKYPTSHNGFPVACSTTPPKVSPGKLASEFADFLGPSQSPRQNVTDQRNVSMSHC